MADLPPGYNLISEEDQKKAATFFGHGQTVAGTGNYEYSVEMYMQGLAIDPDSVDAHQALRDISMKRKASGGKAMGMRERWALKAKDDKGKMLDSEKQLAYDPGNTDHMVALLQNALKSGYYDTVMWIGAILLRANADSPKPDFNKYIVLKDAYKSLKRWREATEVMKYILSMRPDDMDLTKEGKELGALQTMQEGGYEGGASFRSSVKDIKKQQELLVQDTDVRTMDVLTQQITAAEAEWKAEPNEYGKLGKLVDILAKTEKEEHEKRAMELLESAYQATKQFRHRQRSGVIKMQQLTRMERQLRAKLAANAASEQVQKEYRDFIRDKAQQELEIYQEQALNYPTDMGLKFRAAERLFALARYDEAIPIFQQARNDPKYRVEAGIALGRSFLEAGYVEEAIDTLKDLIESYEVKTDKRYVDMTYWYGRALEKKADNAAALKAYSGVAQADFNYRDVQARIKRLRAAAANGSSPAA